MIDGDPAVCAVCGFVDQSSGPDPRIRAVYPEDSEVVYGGSEPTRCQHMFYRMPARTMCGAGKHQACTTFDQPYGDGPCVCMCHRSETSSTDIDNTVRALQQIVDGLVAETAIVDSYFAGLSVTFDGGFHFR